MITLLIVADDFTGALDTGVQFAAAGAVVRVVTDIRYDYRNADKDVQVLVMDAETRHLGSKEAYSVVWDITKRALSCGIPHIYKKTDSALRGNIGSELTALLDASGEKALPFLPAFPKMGRITKSGTHYINNIPVKDSVFGLDPFEPVTCSYIPEIIGQQSDVIVDVIEKWEEEPQRKGINEKGRIKVYDAQSQNQLLSAARGLYECQGLAIMAGCAGFASVLPELLGLGGKRRMPPALIPRLLVICGSVNPITKSQLDYAQRHGFMRLRLTPEQKLDKSYWKSEEGQGVLKDWLLKCQMESRCILDSNDPPGTEETMEYARLHHISLREVRIGIAEAMGVVLKSLVERGLNSTLLITGGDTLLGFMNQIEVCEMEPVCELAPGTVLSTFSLRGNRYHTISKSGGFGKETLLSELADEILDKSHSTKFVGIPH